MISRLPLKRYSVYLRVTEEQMQSTHNYVTAPTAIAAIQSEMLVQKVRFVHYALAFLSDNGGGGESATLIDFAYVPSAPAPRRVVR